MTIAGSIYRILSHERRGAFTISLLREPSSKSSRRGRRPGLKGKLRPAEAEEPSARRYPISGRAGRARAASRLPFAPTDAPRSAGEGPRDAIGGASRRGEPGGGRADRRRGGGRACPRVRLARAEEAQTRALAHRLDAMTTRLESLEANRSRDELANLKKVLAEIKASAASTRDVGGAVGQLARASTSWRRTRARGSTSSASASTTSPPLASPT